MTDGGFGGTLGALDTWFRQRDRPVTAWPIFVQLVRDLREGGDDPFDPVVPPDMVPVWAIDGRQYASAFEHLGWWDQAELTVRWARLDEDGGNALTGAPYELVWLDVRLAPGTEASHLPTAALRGFRTDTLRAIAGEDRARLGELRDTLVVITTVHGGVMRLPDIHVVGPAATAPGADELVGVIALRMHDELERQGKVSQLRPLLTKLGPLARGAAGDWRTVFGGVSGDVRAEFRRRLAGSLSEVMNLLEATANEKADADGLRHLREAACLIGFRLMFLLELEGRRGLLYTNPSAQRGRSLVELAERGEWDGETLLERFIKLTHGVRDGAPEIALRGASIFKNRPTDDFAEATASWLDALDRGHRRLPKPQKTEWSIALRKLGGVLTGQVSDYIQASLGESYGLGGGEHVQRVLGDVYEQILAMEPTREKGRIVLKAGKTQADERKALAAHYTPEGFVYEIVRPALLAVFGRCWVEAKGDLAGYERALTGLRILDPAMGSAHFLTVAALEIARELAWVAVFRAPQPAKFFEPLAPGEPWDGVDPTKLLALERHVRSVLPDVVRRSCYGVDIQPLAAELGKLSLWLLSMTAQPGVTPELTFVDANIRCGDSLVGVRWIDAIKILKERLDLELRESDELAFGGAEIADSRAVLEDMFANLAAPVDDLRAWVERHRAELELAAKESVPEDPHLLREFVLDRARARQEDLRWVLDLAVLAEWHGNAESLFDAIAEHVPALAQLQAKRPAWRDLVAVGQRVASGRAKKVRTAIGELASHLELAKGRTGRAFHWELELPAVFAAGSFDAVVANPPFRGDRDLKEHIGDACVEYLKRRFGAGQVLDYATFFVLRYDELVRLETGIVATVGPNTLAQGKNRRLGIKRLLARGYLRLSTAYQPEISDLAAAA